MGVCLSLIMLFLQLLLSFVLSQNVKQSSTNELCYLQACETDISHHDSMIYVENASSTNICCIYKSFLEKLM